MPPKKKGLLRPIRAKVKSGRGGGDPQAIITDCLANFYEGMQEAMGEVDDATKAAVIKQFNDISDGFGDEFWSSKGDAEMAWTDVPPAK